MFLGEVDITSLAYVDRGHGLGRKFLAPPARTLSEDFWTFYAIRWVPPSILSATSGYR